jgi:hypothetical protein
MLVCGASNSEVVDRFFGKYVHPLSKSYSITELRTGLNEFLASANVSGLAVEVLVDVMVWQSYRNDTNSSTETPGTETETFRLEAGYELQTHPLPAWRRVLFEELMAAYPVSELSAFLATLCIVDLQIAHHGAQVGIGTRLWAGRSGVTIPVGAKQFTLLQAVETDFGPPCLSPRGKTAGA